MHRFLLAFLLISALAVVPSASSGDVGTSDTLRIPAANAYCEPEPEALEISESGIAGWTKPRDRVVWYGHLAAAGRLNLAVALRLPDTTVAKLRISVAHQSRTAQVQSASGPQPVMADFGAVEIPGPGDYHFILEGVSKEGKTFGEPEALLLSGPAIKEAHFSLAETRGAPSVHLSYPIPKEAKVAWFYNEVTVKTDPLWSYYCACGFHRGYFGIQVNSPTERRIIFSVWDSGNEPTDRNKVASENRVQLVAKGKDVFADSFGNEGTGGHSHLVYPWKTGHTYRFLVAAQPEGDYTTYSGYFYFPEKQQWGLIASFRAPKDGGYMHGLYSFNEDFNGADGQQKRLAEFGPAWIKTDDGSWAELLTARFSHTSDGYKERLDRSGGVLRDRFYLSNGGFVPQQTRYGDEFTRAAVGHPPTDIVLPPLPR
jgi:hypothetical protein